MAWTDKIILLVSNLGKGLGVNQVTNLVDVSISSDSGNVLGFGSDNGLKATGIFMVESKSIDGGNANMLYDLEQRIDGGSATG